MKIAYIIAAALSLTISAQAMAHPYNYPYNRGYEHGHRHGIYDRGYDWGYRNNRRGDDGRWIAPLIGGVILGAIITSSNNQRYDNRRVDGDIVYRQPAPRQYVYDYSCDCYR